MNDIEARQLHERTAVIAFAISLAALLMWVVAGTMEDAGLLWPAVGVVGLVGAGASWRSMTRREGSRSLAIAGLVIGGVMFALVAVFTAAFIFGAGWAE